MYKLQIFAASNDTEDDTDNDTERYDALLAILMTFLRDFYDNPTVYMSNTDLMERRALDALQFAFIGYGLTFEEAIEIIQKADESDLSEKQLHEKEMLTGLLDNLIYFAVAAEHQALLEMQKDREESESYDDFEELALTTFKTYNFTYARVENKDILYALSAAALWNSYNNEDIIQFTTQGDERVRVSHQLLDGIRYRKSQFPEALVPPIDWGCRCYLMNTGSTDGRTLTNKANVSKLVDDAGNKAFKYNVAVSGKMFSEFHPYFDIDAKYFDILKLAVTKIKRRILK